MEGKSETVKKRSTDIFLSQQRGSHEDLQRWSWGRWSLSSSEASVEVACMEIKLICNDLRAQLLIYFSYLTGLVSHYTTTHKSGMISFLVVVT